MALYQNFNKKNELLCLGIEHKYLSIIGDILDDAFLAVRGYSIPKHQLPLPLICDCENVGRHDDQIWVSKERLTACGGQLSYEEDPMADVYKERARSVQEALATVSDDMLVVQAKPKNRCTR